MVPKSRSRRMWKRSREKLMLRRIVCQSSDACLCRERESLRASFDGKKSLLGRRHSFIFGRGESRFWSLSQASAHYPSPLHHTTVHTPCRSLSSSPAPHLLRALSSRTTRTDGRTRTGEPARSERERERAPGTTPASP